MDASVVQAGRVPFTLLNAIVYHTFAYHDHASHAHAVCSFIMLCISMILRLQCAVFFIQKIIQNLFCSKYLSI